MAQEEVQVQNQAPPPSARNGELSVSQFGRLFLEPFTHAMAAGLRKALEMGVPVDQILGILLNHVASITAMLEPEGAREETVKDIVRQLAPLVSQHLDMRNKSPGGVLLPTGYKPHA